MKFLLPPLFPSVCSVISVVLITLLLCGILQAEEPWGKDTGLIQTQKKLKTDRSCSPIIFLIRFHQQVISEIDGPRSHFYPSSSEYMRQAINKWGASRGFILGCDRLLRENNEEWVYRMAKFRCGTLKLDPVP
jgi:uncharacterized protein